MLRYCLFLFFFLTPWVAEAAPHRLVSLAPNVTELLFSLDCGDRIVGRTHFSIHPSEAQKITDVGSYVRPSLEKIVMLHPDLCIGVADGTPPSVVRRLEQLGIPVLILDIDSFDAMQSALQKLGQILEIPDTAQRIQEQIRQRLYNASLRVDDLKQGKQIPRVLFQLQERPMVVASSLSFAGKLIELAGAYNAAPSSERVFYPILGREEAARLRPDVVIVAGMDDTAHITKNAERSSVQVIPNWGERIVSVDPDMFTHPSLRALDALEALICILWEK
jgi:iron complex transport system substrate-binding protein